MVHPKVTIIILNWNGLEDTIECLESLKKITYPNYEVIVVDNGSEGDDVEVLGQKFGDYIHIIQNEKNYGFAEGNNIGMRCALNNGADYVLLLNNDTVVDPIFLDEAVQAAQGDATIGIVGPKEYYYDEPSKIASLGARINFWTGGFSILGRNEIDDEQLNETKEVDFVSGAALLIKGSVIQEAGMLYSPFFANWEETDLCIRVKKRGYRVLCVPKARIWHKIARSLPLDDPRRTYLILRGNILFMRRNAKIIHFPSFVAFYFLLRVPSFALRLFRYSSIRNPLRIASLVIKAVRDGITAPIRQ